MGQIIKIGDVKAKKQAVERYVALSNREKELEEIISRRCRAEIDELNKIEWEKEEIESNFKYIKNYLPPNAVR